MPNSIVFNEDCMEVTRRYPDKYFDLAVVDPPYGAGFTEGGGCQGWFAKYHQDSSQSLNVERERADRRGTDSASDLIDTKKTGKKSFRGTWPQEKITLMNFSASHAIKSFGAETTLSFLRRAAF